MLRALLVVLLGLGGATFALGAAGGLWLSGRPLAAERWSSEPLAADFAGTDLVEPPSRAPGARLDGGTGGEPAAGEPEGSSPALVRTVKSATPPLERTSNILLVGVDRRPGASRGGRADTLLLVVLDRGSEHVGLISVPRDLYVELPGHGPARLNATLSVARQQRVDGLDLLRRVVGDTLAMPIEHTVAVDLNVFEHAVDALGGVTLDVPCPILDNFLDPRSDSGRRVLDVAAGTQSMDGVTAAMYVRSRHGRSDWDRARRQQAVLLGLRGRLLTAGGLARLPALWDELGEDVVTDLSRLEMLRLARRAQRTRPEHVHGLVLGHEHTEHWTTPEGQWVLLPRFEAIDSALSQLFSAPTPGARPARSSCPAADVALTRPNRERVRREARARSADVASRAGAPASYSRAPVDSNASHSSSSAAPSRL